jgi:hypothetical protein
MAFIRTIPLEEAEGQLKELYEGDLKTLGYVPNYTQTMSLRPDVIEAWRGFLKVVRGRMRLRRYELVTFAAAAALKCTY